MTPKIALIAVTALLATYMMPNSADARGWRAGGPRGTAGGWRHAGQFGGSAGMGGRLYGRGAAGIAGGRWHGPNGGSLAAGGGGIVGRNAGLVGGRFNGTGPNGGTASGGGAAGWRKGVGGFEQTHMNAQGPGGSTYTGSTKGVYNAQTGQGSYNANRQAYDAKNGQNYGYTDQTSFTKGQGGVTQIDTDHHGDYTVDWKQGTQPVVTHD